MKKNDFKKSSTSVVSMMLLLMGLMLYFAPLGLQTAHAAGNMPPRPWPDMTDNGIIATASGNNPPNETVDQLFDNATSTKWLTKQPTGWVSMQFKNHAKYAVRAYTLTSANDAASRDPKNWELLGSNDGTSWTRVDARTNEIFPSRFQTKLYEFNNNTEYEFYKWNVTVNNGATDAIQLAEIELFTALDDQAVVTQTINALSLGDVSSVVSDLNLPTTGVETTKIEWESSNKAIVDTSGHVTRPDPGQGDANVILTAKGSRGTFSMTKQFTATVKVLTEAEALAEAKAALKLGDTSAVTRDLILPITSIRDTEITWISSNPEIMDNKGHIINKPGIGQPDATLTLTAELSRGALNDEKAFTVTVKAITADEIAVQAAVAAIDLGNTSAVTGDLTLPTLGSQGTSISWNSSDPQILNHMGQVFRPCVGDWDVTVVLTAEVRKGNASDIKMFYVTVKAETTESTDQKLVNEAIEMLQLSVDLEAVKRDLALPKAGLHGITIAWNSSHPNVVDENGKVIRPAANQPDTAVILTATVSKGTSSRTKTFDIVVKARSLDDPSAILSSDATLSGIGIGATSLAGFSKDKLVYDVQLPEDTKDVPMVTAATTDSNATVKISAADRLPGTTTIEVTAEDGIAKQTYKINFLLTSVPKNLEAALSGSSRVVAGQPFDLTFGLRNVIQAVYAQDLTVTYNPAQFEFVSAESLKTGVIIVQTKEKTPGELRILIASLGSGQEVKADEDLLKLFFEAKATIQPTTGTITLFNLVVAGADGPETNVEGTSHNVQIIAVDKAALHALITDAQSRHDATVEGTKVGQYPIGSKAALQAAIDKAKVVADNAAADLQQVEQATVELNAAMQAFISSIISRASGDLNGDGRVSIGDLAIVASWYGKKLGDLDWEKYKLADINNDGKIDIADLAATASMILN
ncbi:immunoglobulin-like domain-containing protein [Paenibacillus planticolens]|uniref:Dockerin domain-containing protein n=1 Tax=Paenibacillus planticolens TaxID=2654976 RepID=A0ABX1ZFN6_9BACL|nr:immunoglobulin-like domain-containing protein [Paenibacillus planticolens]NOU98895.1 hypothetical protein [Paenibacillus planticolens]